MAKIDPKWLTGIKMTGSTEKEIEKDGRKTKQYIPWERPATEEDVLSFRSADDSVVIVIKDGRKYEVSKKAEEKK